VKVSFTKSFTQDYRSLPPRLQKTTDKQLGLLLTDPHHPCLNIKKMHDPREIWEGRITRTYRFTFQIQGDTYILRRLGTHDVLKQP